MGREPSILVIKLGAFGNIVLSLGAFAAIRHHHADAFITLLTTAPYAAWMETSPYFDRVWVDERPTWWDVRGIVRLRHLLGTGRFARVYDLQTSRRSSQYFRLLPRPRPEWSGIVSGCSHPDADPARDTLHDQERVRRQLGQAGISDVPRPDLDWCRGDIARFGLPEKFALLVPGSSIHRPVKRWPALRYGEVARDLARAGITSVVLGTGAEAPLAAEIARVSPAVDLTGATGFGDLASLARAARLAIGNDTGPMHLIAAAGCPSLVLFSADSDPALCIPRGERVAVLREPSLEALPMARVRDAALQLLAPVSV